MCRKFKSWNADHNRGCPNGTSLIIFCVAGYAEIAEKAYSSRDYTEMLEATVAGGLAEKVPLSTDDYTVSDISLEFNVVGDRVEYIFYCDVDFYVRMFGHSYPTITQRVELTGYHNTKF